MDFVVSYFRELDVVVVITGILAKYHNGTGSNQLTLFKYFIF